MIQTPNVRSAKIIVVVITDANFAIAICTGSVLPLQQQSNINKTNLLQYFTIYNFYT
jgi:hypothetical protein